MVVVAVMITGARAMSLPGVVTTVALMGVLEDATMMVVVETRATHHVALEGKTITVGMVAAIIRHAGTRISYYHGDWSQWRSTPPPTSSS